VNKKIVMFDMDGTLTEPRQHFNSKALESALYQLINADIHIGIITGSDEDYLREQMGSFLNNSSCRYKTHLMPCNGTKYFKPPEFSNQDFKLSKEVCMRTHMGTKDYRNLIQELVFSQVDMTNEGIPLTGHFINCRGSMINWCPIGRNAGSDDREIFMILDQKKGLRKRALQELKEMLKNKGLLKQLTIKFGGDTSFDIYPKGWDKTYGLRHFQGWEVWFVGDRCEPSGNDYELYEACLDRSYVTSGPEHTREIVQSIISNMIEV
tara:strand:+ start:389 stop:1183 length:795 start_codon:yes stop_codon:yes gene_type:complete